jgi:hypothetical protein
MPLITGTQRSVSELLSYCRTTTPLLPEIMLFFSAHVDSSIMKMLYQLHGILLVCYAGSLNTQASVQAKSPSVQ